MRAQLVGRAGTWRSAKRSD